MRILLAGNHTCGNGGDGAILHGMTDSRQATQADDGTVKLNVNIAVAQARETGNRITEELLTVLG